MQVKYKQTDGKTYKLTIIYKLNVDIRNGKTETNLYSW